MNIQDLQSISYLKIPVVICVINNNGYLAIRHTQQGFLENRYYGTHPDWKLGMIDFKKAAKAFKISYLKLDNNQIQDLYLAYHEGINGYRKQNFRKNKITILASKKVAKIAIRYKKQLEKCKAQKSNAVNIFNILAFTICDFGSSLFKLSSIII